MLPCPDATCLGYSRSPMPCSDTRCIQSVKPICRAGERRRLFGGGAAGGDVLEGVPQRGVAAAALVDREIALEHRALGAEGGDAGLDIGPPGGGEFLRARRQFARVEVEPEHPHAQPAQLDMRIGAGCQLPAPPAPFCEHLVALASLAAPAARAAAML